MATLFISAPHFPPSAMPPSQRVRLLVRHLHEFGWQPVVFSVSPTYREDVPDPWMLDITGDKFELIETGCLDPRKTRKFGIGDLGLRVFFYLFFSLLKNSRKKKPAAILYPVPPWYIMVMAPVVKWMTGIPYAIDFIDPWVYKVRKGDRKAAMSQWIAKRLEGFAVKRSSAIFAVSQGILDELVDRHPSLAKIPRVAVPYGVEASDFLAIKTAEAKTPPVILRYTGAISDAMLPVVATLFKALKVVNAQIPLKVIFTGTSYAAADQVKPILRELIEREGVSAFVTENPARVGYRQALEMSLSADMQLLIGDTTPYYAASKLMGLAVSGRPFFAFIHRHSFPASFLTELNYRYKADFETEELSTEGKVRELTDAILFAISEKDRFKGIDASHPVIAQHTATAMTKKFSDTLKQIAHV